MNNQRAINAVPDQIYGPVQDEVNVINSCLDSLSVSIEHLISKIGPILGDPSPTTDSKNGLSNPSHCPFHARLMIVTERVQIATAILRDANERLKL